MSNDPINNSEVSTVRNSTPGDTGRLAAFGIFGVLALMVVAGWFAPLGANLVLITLGMLLIMIILGVCITNRAFGILINERNLMSLSRFQMAIWTVSILAAYFTFALVRIKVSIQGGENSHALNDPLNVAIDWHLWALLGISTTSLVGSPLILSTKTTKVPAPSVTQKTAFMTKESVEDVATNSQGLLYANSGISDACLSDMFQGDELSNTTQIDLANVRMFYFTVIAAICFFVTVFKLLVVGNSHLGQLPMLPDGLIAILGFSHAGYLTSKSIGHTQS